MNDKTQECIEMLSILLEMGEPVVLDEKPAVVVNDCRIDSYHFVLKKAIEILNKASCINGG